MRSKEKASKYSLLPVLYILLYTIVLNISARLTLMGFLAGPSSWETWISFIKKKSSDFQVQEEINIEENYLHSIL